MKSCKRFQFSNWSVNNRSLLSSCLSRIKLTADEFQRLVQLLQIVDEQVRPRSIHRLLLADDSFLKIEPALPPPENLRNCRLAVQRAVHRVANGPLLQIDFADSAGRFKSEPAAALAQTAHLKYLGSRKLIQITNQRMAGINSLAGRR